MNIENCSVKELVNQHQPSEILDAEELAELKQAAAAGDHDSLDDEAVVNKVREQIIEKRSEIYKKNEAEITARWTYEEAVREIINLLALINLLNGKGLKLIF